MVRVSAQGGSHGVPGPRSVDGGRQESRGDPMRELESLSRRRGRSLFDGLWLTSEEIARHHRRLKRRSALVLLETAGVLLLLVALANFLWRMVRGIAG